MAVSWLSPIVLIVSPVPLLRRVNYFTAMAASVVSAIFFLESLSWLHLSSQPVDFAPFCPSKAKGAQAGRWERGRACSALMDALTKRVEGVRCAQSCCGVQLCRKANN